MNNVESCSIQELSAYARWFGDQNAMNDVSSRFASYLRVFGNFFQLDATKLRTGTSQLLRDCCVRFPLAPASVAFV